MDNALPVVTSQTPPALQGLGARLVQLPPRSLWAAGLGVLAVLVLAAWIFTQTRHGDFRILFPGLQEREAAQVIDRLTQLNIPHRLAEGSGAVLVPSSRYHEARMKLSSAGIPKGTVSGYELLDQAPFGQTQGQELAHRQRALEGELVRTIQTLASVESARVHLALPAQTGFFREQLKPSASVSVNLHPGRTLDAQQVAGIVHLVSSSVPGLSPKAVTVVDGRMELLTAPLDAQAGHVLDAQQLKHLRAIEDTHARRVLELLEPLYGRDNVRATITAEVDFSQVQSTAEEFKPNQGDAPAAVRAVRSEDATGSAVGPLASGIPGAVSNQPPDPAASAARPGAAPAPSGGRKEVETRFELDKKVSVTQYATGVVRRLHAAVVINHRPVTDESGKTTLTPLNAEEIKQLTELVQQGIGYDDKRGDSVRVVNSSFRVVDPVVVAPPPWWRQPWLLDTLGGALVPAALAAVALALIFGVIRPALRPAFSAPSPTAATGGGVNLMVSGETPLSPLNPISSIPAPAEVPALPAPDDAKIDAIREFAKQNPAAVASVLRTWISREGA